MFDWQKSKEVAKAIDARIGGCVLNTARAVLDFRHLLPVHLMVVEGYWMSGGQLDGHAWIESEDNIIDPTFVLFERYELERITGLYPVVKYSEEEIESFRRIDYRPQAKSMSIRFDQNSPEARRVRNVIDPDPSIIWRNQNKGD